MSDPAVKATQKLGWLLLIGGALGFAGIGIYQFVIDTGMPVYVKVLTSAVWVGLGVLFVSVLRQRLIERRSDKYKDVEI